MRVAASGWLGDASRVEKLVVVAVVVVVLHSEKTQVAWAKAREELAKVGVAARVVEVKVVTDCGGGSSGANRKTKRKVDEIEIEKSKERLIDLF